MTPSSDELAKAFANRSAAFFELKRHNDCIQDIEWSFKFNYPKASQDKLLLRKAKCLLAKAEFENARSILEELSSEEITKSDKIKNEVEKLLESSGSKKPSSPVNKKPINPSNPNPSNSSNPVPFLPSQKLERASSSLSLAFSVEKGKHVVANKAIRRYEFVLIEDPFVSCIKSEFEKHYCHFCHKPLKWRVFPCRNCIEVGFCDEKCAKSGWREKHKFECRFVFCLNRITNDRPILHFLFKNGSIQNALKEYKIFNQKEKNGPMDSFGRNYRSILALVDHFDDLELDAKFLESCRAATLLMLLSDKMRLISPDDGDFMVVGELMMKHSLQLNVNAEPVFRALARKVSKEDVITMDVSQFKIGTALYSIVSLMNHSCDPNVELYKDGEGGRTYKMRAARDIAIADELCIVYVAEFYSAPRANRRRALRQKYFFECRCHACADDSRETATGWRCPRCEGLLVYDDARLDSVCLQCGKRDVDVRAVLAEISNSEKKLFSAAKLKRAGQMSEAKKVLLEVHEVFCRRLHPLNYNVALVKNELIDCCQDPAEELMYCSQVAEIFKNIRGDTSYEYSSAVFAQICIRSQQFLKNDASQQFLNETSQLTELAIKLYKKLINDKHDDWRELNESLDYLNEVREKLKAKGV